MAIKLEEKLERDAEALDKEMESLRQSWAVATKETAEGLKGLMDAVNATAQADKAQIEAAKERAQHEADVDIRAMEDRLQQASEAEKARIEKRIAEAKAEHAKRMAKLEEANEHIKKALGL